MSKYDNPARTVALLRELVAVGFSDTAFSILHHYKVPETIASHRRYCEDLKEEGGCFRTNNNKLVQRRLELLVALYRAGKFASTSSEVFEHLARAALSEVPHDIRPLSEQVND